MRYTLQSTVKEPTRAAKTRLFLAVTLSAAPLLLFINNLTEYGTSRLSSRTAALAVALTLLNSIVALLFGEDGDLSVDAFSPRHFYSLFYFIYYVFPLFIIVLSPQIEDFEFFTVAAAVAVGLAAFHLGCKITGKNVIPVPYSPRPSEGRAMFVISIFLISLVAVFYGWRIRTGNFYTHASTYTVGTDTTSSLMESFVLYLQFPAILLLGALTSSEAALSKWSNRLLVAYSGCLFLTFVASSQFRLAMEVLFLAWVARNLRQRHTLPLKTAIKLGTLGLLTLVVIFTIRQSGANYELSESKNQLVDLISGLANGSLFDPSAVVEATTGAGETTSKSRLLAPLLFFGEVITVFEDSSIGHGNGNSLLYETKEIIPRLLWPDKPQFLSTQIFIRQNLGMVEIDSSPHPLLQFYYEFGWPGIVGAFMLLGMGMQYIALRLTSSFTFIMFAFVWPAVIQVEVGLYLNLLSVIRAGIITFIAWKILSATLTKASENKEPTFRQTIVRARH